MLSPPRNTVGRFCANEIGRVTETWNEDHLRILKLDKSLNALILSGHIARIIVRLTTAIFQIYTGVCKKWNQPVAAQCASQFPKMS